VYAVTFVQTRKNIDAFVKFQRKLYGNKPQFIGQKKCCRMPAGYKVYIAGSQEKIIIVIPDIRARIAAVGNGNKKTVERQFYKIPVGKRIGSAGKVKDVQIHFIGNIEHFSAVFYCHKNSVLLNILQYNLAH
jgi:hypothetical protein